MLGEDYLSKILRVIPARVPLLPVLTADIDVIAVDECDHIGVLLDASALSKVRQKRPVIRSLLDRAAEL